MIATLISVLVVGALLAAALILVAAASRKISTVRYQRTVARFLADKELRQRQDANRHRGDLDAHAGRRPRSVHQEEP